MMRKIFYLCAVIFCFPSFRCTTPDTAGSGTETTNGIYGIIDTTGLNGCPVTSLIAALYSTDYRPDSAIGIADTLGISEDGSFSVTPPPGNRYNLLIMHPDKYLGVMLPQLPPDTTLDPVTLAATGTIVTKYTGIIGAVAPGPYQVIIPGTPFFIQAEAFETVQLPPLPEGIYAITVRQLSSDNNDTVVTDTTVLKAINPLLSDTSVLVVP
jgi:hypothetical protein